MGHHAPSLRKSIITQIFHRIFVQIASLTFSRNGGTMSTTKGGKVNEILECDANRTPLCVTDNLDEYKGKWGYEIYEIRSDGRTTLIQDWE